MSHTCRILMLGMSLFSPPLANKDPPLTSRAWTRMVVKRDHPKAAAHHGGKDEVEGEEGKGGKTAGKG